MRTLRSYLIEMRVVNEGTVESYVDKALEATKSRKEAVKWLKNTAKRDNKLGKVLKKAIDMVEKMPDSLFYEEQKLSDDEENIDWDNIDEYYDENEEMIEEDDWQKGIDEALKRKRVVRGGKIMVKKKSDKPGYKIVGGKEKRMTPMEIQRRKRAAKKAARKRKSKKSISSLKRKKSLKKRTW